MTSMGDLDRGVLLSAYSTREVDLAPPANQFGNAPRHQDG